MRFDQAQDSLLFELTSIVEPIPLDQLFPTAQPLEVELGAGDGSFLVNYARLHPERNFIGVERLLGRIQKIDRKARRAGLKNVRAIRIESAYFIQYLLPPGCVSALHIYFPDPWPKRKHWKYRLINDGFPALAKRVLISTGTVYLRTDDEPYFDQMRAAFESCPDFKNVETPADLLAVTTDFEAGFLKAGLAIFRAACQLK